MCTEVIVIPDDIHDLYQSIKKLDRWQREVVTQVITYSRDVVKARNRGEKYPQPLLLMVHGGAGAGKSTVINESACWAEKILQQPGDNLNCAYVYKMALTVLQHPTLMDKHSTVPSVSALTILSTH